MPHGSRRLRAGWRRKHSEGEIVAWVFGLRIRLYAGHSYAFGRPFLYQWRMDEHRGIVLRFRRDGGQGAKGRRVFGLQWRPA